MADQQNRQFVYSWTSPNYLIRHVREFDRSKNSVRDYYEVIEHMEVVRNYFSEEEIKPIQVFESLLQAQEWVVENDKGYDMASWKPRVVDFYGASHKRLPTEPKSSAEIVRDSLFLLNQKAKSKEIYSPEKKVEEYRKWFIYVVSEEKLSNSISTLTPECAVFRGQSYSEADFAARLLYDALGLQFQQGPVQTSFTYYVVLSPSALTL